MDGDGAEYTVPGALSFPLGSHTIHGTVEDLMGNVSNAGSYTFGVVDATAAIRPFETNVNPCQVWNLLFTRDLYTTTMTGANTINVTSVLAANGLSDFDEDLALFGFRTASPVTIPGTSFDSNGYMRYLVVERIKHELTNDFFAGVNILFTEENLGTIPGNAPQIDYHLWGHSQISIGGASDVGALGCAFIDRNNAHQDNDTLFKGSYPYNPGTNLGVFPTTIFSFNVNYWSGSPFRTTFDPFIPNRGTPVGEDPDDQAILMQLAGVGPAVSGDAATRRDRIALAVNRLARAIATTTAHEMGHSLGVAVDGVMPHGLYGGLPVYFPGSNSNHLDLTHPKFGLFTSPAGNIMKPYTIFEETINEGTRFCNLSLAYLREKILYY